MNTTDRVIEFIKASGLTQKQFADQARMQQPHISAILNGKRKAESAIVNKLVLFMRGNPDWFEKGEGEMYINKSINESLESEWMMKYYKKCEEMSEQSILLAKYLEENKRLLNEIERLKEESSTPQRRAGAKSA